MGEGRRGGQPVSVVHRAGRCAVRIVHKSTTLHTHHLSLVG
ncbi:hypothetical protein EBME_1263 [bacterium endosymbiont of Mortierella elongata FMR23-6]|nr:hypothetical protein EBME_1263 [bacterium endosymbiont of Mortierella elongata FMR23-6]